MYRAESSKFGAWTSSSSLMSLPDASLADTYFVVAVMVMVAVVVMGEGWGGGDLVDVCGMVMVCVVCCRWWKKIPVAGQIHFLLARKLKIPSLIFCNKCRVS